MNIYYDPETDITLQKTFNKIWQKYYKKICVFCRGIMQQKNFNTDDIVQDVMFKIFKNLDNYNNKYSISTWIYTIARNTCLDYIRKKKTDTYQLEEGRVGSSTCNPETELQKRNTEEIVKKYIQELEYIDSQIAFLRFYEDMKIKQISRIINIPEGTVKYKIHNIKKGLKNYLKEADYVN